MKHRRSALIMIVLLCASGAMAGATQQGGAGQTTSDMLSPDQTVASVFLGKRNLHARANPETIPYLYTLLCDSSVHPRVPRYIFRVIGYVGTKQDVRRVIAMAKEVEGALDDRAKYKMLGIMECLGLMTRRSIPEAKDALLEMTRREYWTDGPSWHTDDYLKKHPEGRFSGMIEATRALAVYGGQDVTDQATRILQHAPDKATRDLLSLSLDLDALQGLAQKRSQAEAEEVSESDRKNLAEIANYVSSQGRTLPSEKAERHDVPLSADETAFVYQIINEAVSAYETIKSGVVAGGKAGGITSRLLDDGQPLDVKRLEGLRAEYEKDLAREGEILTLLDERQSKAVNVKVRRELVYRTPEVPAGEETAVTKTEGITVTFQLSESAEVGNVLLRHQKGSLTVGKDGTLIVVMKKINGEWYWNPFGW